MQTRVLALSLVALAAAACSGGGDGRDLPDRAALEAEANTLARGMLDLESVTCADVSAGGTSAEDYGGVLVGIVSESEDPAVLETIGVEALRRAWVSGLAPVESVRLSVVRPDGSALVDGRDVLGGDDPAIRPRALQEERFGPRPDPLPAPAATDPGPLDCRVPGISPPKG